MDIALRHGGLDVARYSPEQLRAEFGADFRLLERGRELHMTPTGAEQPFIYCVFVRDAPVEG